MTMAEVLAAHAELDNADSEWLSKFVHEWHLLADTSFSDLVLWVPDGQDPNVFWAAAQIRPTTGPTALDDSIVGECISYDPESVVVDAYWSGEICQASEHSMDAGIPVDMAAIPIVRNDHVVAVVERSTNQMGVRAPGALEDAYLEIAQNLAELLHEGKYPVDPSSDLSMSPTAGDGVTLLDDNQVITYASPNAVSAWRRLGILRDLVGEKLPDLISQVDGVSPQGDEVEASKVAEFDLETANTALRLRVLPLGGGKTLVLCRDITELRDRDRELITKDATIKEIHHRVKNNLQTVAALLRLQSRRTKSEDARDALRDAMRRVTSIATVHEILSQGFDEEVEFDEIADRILEMVGDVAATTGELIATRTGTFGMVPAEVATPLSLALTELCHNGVEHGLNSGSGQIVVRPRVSDETLSVEVVDNGAGLPAGFEIGDSLGLSIVTTLIEDLGGKFSLTNNGSQSPFPTGCTAKLEIPLAR